MIKLKNSNMKFLKTFKFPFKKKKKLIKKFCAKKSGVCMILNQNTKSFCIKTVSRKNNRSNPFYNIFKLYFCKRQPPRDFIGTAMRIMGRKSFSFHILGFIKNEISPKKRALLCQKLKIQFIKKHFVLKSFKFPEDKDLLRDYTKGKLGVYQVINEITGYSYTGKVFTSQLIKNPHRFRIRCRQHFNGYGGVDSLTKSIEHYKSQNFSFNILQFEKDEQKGFDLEFLYMHSFESEYNKWKKKIKVKQSNKLRITKFRTRVLQSLIKLKKVEETGVPIIIRDNNYSILGHYPSLNAGYRDFSDNTSLTGLKTNLDSGKFYKRAGLFIEFNLPKDKTEEKNYKSDDENIRMAAERLESKLIETGRVKVTNTRTKECYGVFNDLKSVQIFFKNPPRENIPKISHNTLRSYAHNVVKRKFYPINIEYEYRDIKNACLLYMHKSIFDTYSRT